MAGRIAKTLTAAAAVALTLGTNADAEQTNTPVAYSQSQGWSEEDARRWYSLSQGSRLISEKWLKALTKEDGEPFFNRSALTEYGYPFGSNKDFLPLGFTVDADVSGDNWIGINCSACHTSVLRSGAIEVHVHGGQSMANFQEFLGDLIGVVETTASQPDRFAKFASAVSTGSKNVESTEQLKQKLADWLKLRKRIQSAEPKNPYGHGRSDAVGVILAKTAYIVAPDSKSELPKSNAPVSYPFVWNTNQQALLQHNGVVSNGSDYGPFAVTKLGALIRNWTEVLGVFGEVKMNPADLSVSSSIHLENLLELEQILARLKSPRWPTGFGPIDETRSKRGKALYDENCASCHAVLDPDDLSSEISLREVGQSSPVGPFLMMQPIVDLSVTSRMQAAGAPRGAELIGTDPLMACNSTLHVVETGMLRGEIKLLSVSGSSEKDVFGDYAITTDILTTLINKEVRPRLGELGKAYLRDQGEGAIELVRSFVIEKLTKGFTGSSYDPEKPGNALDQFLADCADNTVLAHLRNNSLPLPAYKARPLNGIWATAPFLHNGSVPTLDDLLKPQSERPARYGYLDGLFDTKKIGLVDRIGDKGASILNVYDKSGQPVPGNWNGGHEYGTALNEDERLDLLEYLKSL